MAQPADSQTVLTRHSSELELAAAGARRRSRPARSFRLTDRDLELLRFIASQRFVFASHVHTWFGADRAVAYRRLSGLVGLGLVAYRRIFHAQPGCYQIAGRGLAMIDSELPRPTIDLRSYRHDAGVAWLWLLARGGRFGSFERLLSERELRSRDQRADQELERFGIPVGYDRAGRARVHFPDLLLLGADGSRVALELELTQKARARLQSILLGYRADPRLRRVIYITDRRSIARAVSETSVMFAVDQLVLVECLSGSTAREPAGEDGLARGLLEVAR